MKVITIYREPFTEECRALFEKVKNNGYNYDLTIGIATGGAYVGKLFCEFSPGLNYFEVKLQRNSTEVKNESIFKSLIKKIPRKIANFLRIVEHLLRSYKKKTCEKYSDPVIDENNIKKIQNSKSILIVDDALDTGGTILKLSNYINGVNKNCTIHCAVITSTMKNPLIQPTFYNYKNVLIRFPWSFDFKNE